MHRKPPPPSSPLIKRVACSFTPHSVPAAISQAVKRDQLAETGAVVSLNNVHLLQGAPYQLA